MATGPNAVNLIAVMTGIPVVTVDKVARMLKQHQPPMWARSVQGGGAKSEHVEPWHLTNLALALNAADPITSAPRVVTELRQMTPPRAARPFLPGTTLGEVLDLFIARGADDITGATTRVVRRCPEYVNEKRTVLPLLSLS
jgi:hypothetical protein